MKIRKWKHGPFTYPVMKLKSAHLAQHLSHSCQTTFLKVQCHNTTNSSTTRTNVIVWQLRFIHLQYPPTTPTSLISGDDNDDLFTPIIRNPLKLVPYIPNCQPRPLQLCQQISPIPDTPGSPTPENRGQSDIFQSQ